MAYADVVFDVADILPGLSRIDRMLAKLQAKVGRLGANDAEVAAEDLPHLETLLPRLQRIMDDAEELAAELRDDDEPSLKFRKPRVCKNATPAGYATQLLERAQLARAMGCYLAWREEIRPQIAALEAAAG